MDVDDFAGHLRRVLGALLEGQVPQYERPRWRAGAYRWTGTSYDLKIAVEEAGGYERALSLPQHPDTADWARRGLVLDAPTLAGQAEQLDQHPAYASGQDQGVVGDSAVTGLGRAVAALTRAVSAAGFERAVRAICAGEHLEHLISGCARWIQSAPTAMADDKEERMPTAGTTPAQSA